MNDEENAEEEYGKCERCGKLLSVENGEVYTTERWLDTDGHAATVCEEHYAEAERLDVEENEKI